MTDYTKTTDFAAKDDLTTGNANKVVSGTEIDDEFNNIATAVATKLDSTDFASQAEAEALTSDTKIITPHSLNDVLVDNAGALGDIQALVDPNADRILFWDDSDGAVEWLTVGTGLAITTNTLATNDAGIDHDSLSNFVANEHINHSSVSITAGSGLTGGGDLTTTRTVNVGAGNGITVNADDVALAATAAGAGLTYTSGVLAVGAGDGITVNANDIDVDSTVVRTTGTQTVGGAKTFSADTVFQGDIEVQDQVKFSGVITDDIGASTGEDNYNPTGFANASIVRVVHTATCAITGMAGGVDGRIVILANVDDDDTHSVNFTEESGSSTAANRFTVAGTIGPGESTAFWYDGTSSRWRPITGV